MTDRKPIVLTNVTLNHSRTVGPLQWYQTEKQKEVKWGGSWTADYSRQWTPLSDINFVELWQKSESVEHFSESYKFNHPEGKGYEPTGVQAARKRYDNLSVGLKCLRRDANIKKEVQDATDLAQMRMLAATLSPGCSQ